MLKIISNYTFKMYKQVIFHIIVCVFLISLWVVTVSYLKSQASTVCIARLIQ